MRRTRRFHPLLQAEFDADDYTDAICEMSASVKVTANDNPPLTTVQPDPDEYHDHLAYSWHESHSEWPEEVYF